jgi:hypothetical protein
MEIDTSGAADFVPKVDAKIKADAQNVIASYMKAIKDCLSRSRRVVLSPPNGWLGILSYGKYRRILFFGLIPRNFGQVSCPLNGLCNLWNHPIIYLIILEGMGKF